MSLRSFIAARARSPKTACLVVRARPKCSGLVRLDLSSGDAVRPNCDSLLSPDDSASNPSKGVLRVEWLLVAALTTFVGPRLRSLLVWKEATFRGRANVPDYCPQEKAFDYWRSSNFHRGYLFRLSERMSIHIRYKRRLLARNARSLVDAHARNN